VCWLLGACGQSAPPAGAASGTTPFPSPAAAVAGLNLVAIGDSIPFNSPQDCPGCTGFVDRYADAVSTATGQRVTVENLSEHTGLTLPGLLAEFGSLQTRLAAADVIVVGIAHNSFELSSDNPCGAPADADHLPDWSRVDAACAAASTAKYQPQFEKLFSQVSALREGKPTVLRTINP